MDWQQRMNNALEYIEANLDGQIDMNIVAMKALCSPYNFQRMFSFLTDITLANYIRGRRLSLAAEELVGGKSKIIDVALRYGYESATSFARAFTQFHGITPSEAKNSRTGCNTYPKLNFDLYKQGIPYKGESVMTKRKKGRLILIDGMCGTGKSTTAQKLTHQFALHALPHRWMHEEIAEHPIRDDEFTMGDTKTHEGMEINMREMLKRWQVLADTVVESGETVVMEGCFLQAICRYFAGSICTVEQTLDYFNRVSDILSQAGTLFVYLKSPDVKVTLEHLYPIRGQWWKDLILSPDESGTKYFHISEYKGDETVYETWDLYQQISDEVFARYSGDKLKIDAPVGSWPDHPRKIVKHIGLPYIDVPSIEVQSPEKFCGRYGTMIDGEKCEIEIRMDTAHTVLYAVGFWPYMKLVPVAPDTFEMESFPITLSFSNTGNVKVIVVTGDYDWNIVGSTLKEIV